MPHKTKAARREYHRKYRALHPEQLARDQKKYRGTGGKRRTTLLRKFGITEATYRKLFTEQGGVCKICHKPETQKYKKVLTKLAVDHCHKGSKVRGLLCSRCNRGLGYFMDDLSLLLSAAEYLRTHTSVKEVPVVS